MKNPETGSRGSGTNRPYKLRMITVGLLVACVTVLLLLNVVTQRVIDRKEAVLPIAEARPVLQEINTAVDSLLFAYRIEKRSMRSWYVQNPEKKNIRVERRVLVPPDFPSVSFNQELNRLVAQYGARAVATERTKESTVTMHISIERKIVESISFVMKSAK